MPRPDRVYVGDESSAAVVSGFDGFFAYRDQFGVWSARPPFSITVKDLDDLFHSPPADVAVLLSRDARSAVS